MSIARDHAEWLSLVPTSGPFLSMETLLRVFPQGLPGHDPERTRLLRLAFGEWESAEQKRRPDQATQNQALHTAWIRFVLSTILGLPSEALKEGQGIPERLKAEKPEFAQTLRPNLILTSLSPQSDELSLDFDGPATPTADSDEKTLLLVQTYERSQGLEKPCKGNWTASPAARMAELLFQTQVPLGLVTNGEEWLLVHRATDTVGYATFFATLWLEEPLTLRAFRALLGAERFFGDSDETLLRLLTDSADEQHEVTDQLGYQVRRAVEMLVQALDEIDRGRGGTLLAGVPGSQLYDGALTVMMRLVFLLCAEERGMFPIEEEIYSRHYAVSTLMESLREAADKDGEEVLERRSDAWSRLLATFRAIWAGVEHEAMRLPAYGGSLLDPHRYSWLDSPGEGVSALPLHNRTVLHLLEALQILRLKVPGGGPAETRRLSFRALDIEQIGHVYEGLLDHTAVRAVEPILGLAGTKDKEPEIALARLETEQTKGCKEFLKFLREETGRTEKALQNGLDNPAVDLDEGRLLAACEGDAALLSRVRPFASLVRRDDFGRYVVVPKGSVYVTAGTTRRSTGTHYTPRSLTEPIVRRTLEPLIYRGMAQGFEPSPETLRTASEILALKVCDIACGSGAFIVEGCRYLADRLCEAWAITEQAAPDALLTTPIGTPSTGSATERLIPDAHETPEERRMLARRLIAAHCLYGVDKNPAAVEIAKLSLWLVTMDRDKPFHFLDHAIKSGDSLIGCSREQILTWSLSGKAKPQASILDMLSSKVFEEAISLRRDLDQLPSDRIEFIERKARLHREAEMKMARAHLAADLVIAPALMSAKPKVQETKRADFQTRFVALPNPTNDALLRNEVAVLLGELHPFHWPLEFPDIFHDGGFDAIIGNPPFMGGQKITGELGVPYREHLVAQLGRGKKGSADIVAYFFLRALELLKTDGSFGLIATNTIAQGDTREVGLEQIIDDGHSVYAALPSMKWPGKANLEVAIAHTYKGVWGGKRNLSGRDVADITAFLDDGIASGKPFRLAENAGKSFQGSILLGMGFVLEPEQAQALIAKDTKYMDALSPYLNGEDLNSRPDQSPSRWVINFKDWPLGRIGQTLPVSGETLQHVADTIEINLSDEWRPKAGSRWEQADTERREKWLRIGVVPSDYRGPVASDYPECLEIIERLVKPERDKVDREVRRRYWWRFAELAKGLYDAIADLPRVLSCPIFTKHCLFIFVPKNMVYMNKMYIFPIADNSQSVCLSSTLHEVWARQYSATLGGVTMQYAPTDCFETFPFPVNESGIVSKSVRTSLERLGEVYHEHRRSVCLNRNLGLTKVYNLFHTPTCQDADIADLRRLHVEMDNAVAGAYGWEDLDLGHGFHGENKETRFTLHPDAKGEVLRRLLTLNHERHAEQEAEADEIMPTVDAVGMPRKKHSRKATTAQDSAVDQGTLDDLLIDKIVADHEIKTTSSRSSEQQIRERAALMATYLIMRAEAPEQLSRLRRHPARMRLTTPRRYTRTRLAKHLYFTQEMVRVEKNERSPVTALSFTEYQRGPYTKEILNVEEEAFQRGWLIGEADYHEGRSSVSYRLGPKADEAVKRALELLGPSEAHLDQELIPLDEPRTTRSEQWTTIHFAWNTLRQQTGRMPSFAEVQAYVSDWKPDRAAFAYNTVATIYRELELRKLLR